MPRLLIAIGLIVTAIICAQAIADPANEKPKTIPLDTIWAYEMPGTKDVRELEPKLDVHDPGFKELFQRSKVHQMVSFLSGGTPGQGEKARPGFVVVGTDKKSLANAREMLLDRNRERKQQAVPKDTELSLVFYHYATGWHPQINSVEQWRNSVIVKYQFINPEEPSFGAARFALIPLGKLPAGRVNVKFEQAPPVDFKGQPSQQKPNTERIVCGSFSFDVQ
jgi:hypothetical protein